MRDNWNDWQANIEEITGLAGEDFANLTDSIDADIESIINDTDDLTAHLEDEVYPEIETFVDDVITVIDDWATNWNSSILSMNESLESYID